MKRIVLTSLMASVLVAGALAQTSEVGQRKENQQDRIAQGVKSGQLTAGETSNLEKKESAVNQEVRTDRSLNGGKLTQGEKQTVNNQQNQMSNQIYKDKHNTAQQHYGNNKVDARRENQQDRIANGIASGKLNAAQTSRLEKGQASINQEVHTDRSLNGGKLTQGEKKIVNKQQNQASKQVYKAKH
ncbi:conserved exported hypothetical protein [Candidatus Sulfopaludibacter sp. SbA3]|nr:conserved exported hypothetical protein [Candidatus Sulfopaludibacter sp. SbA3]